MSLLLTRDANVNITSDAGYAPSMYAAQRDKKSMIIRLLDKGADINYANSGNDTVDVSARAGPLGHRPAVTGQRDRS